MSMILTLSIIYNGYR